MVRVLGKKRLLGNTVKRRNTGPFGSHLDPAGQLPYLLVVLSWVLEVRMGVGGGLHKASKTSQRHKEVKVSLCLNNKKHETTDIESSLE